MPTPDYSFLSDEQLQAIIDADQQKTNSWSNLSDSDLQAIANKSDVSTGEALGRGAAQGLLFNFEPQVMSASALATAGETPFGPSTYNGMTPEDLSSQIKQQEQTRNKLAEQQHGGAYLTGSIAGNIANPINYVLPEAKGASLLSDIGTVAAPQAAMGALSGYGAGETTDQSLKNAASGLVFGGGLGAIGGAISHAISSPSAESLAELNKFDPADIKAAADKLGIQIPTYILGGEPARAVAAGVKNIPIAGKPLTSATENVMGQLGKVVDNLGGVDPYEAGLALKTGVINWTGPVSKKIVSDAYDNVDNYIKNPDVTTYLQNTLDAASNIKNTRTTAALPGDSEAIKFVRNALSRDEGLTYQGIKDLRSAVGRQIDTAGYDPEMKQIYAGLTKDLEQSIQNSNLANPDKLDALKAWQDANTTAAQVANQRNKLSQLLGQTGSEVPAESVFNRALKAAKAGPTGNSDLLANAIGKVDPSVWQDLAGGVVSTLARDNTGAFSPAKFLGPQGYNSLSERGKYFLFGPQGTAYRDSLDALATMSAPAKEMQGQLDKGIKYGALGYAALNHPMSLIGSLFGGKTVANMLAQPATAQSLANWAKFYNIAQKTGNFSANLLGQAAASLNKSYTDAYGSTLTYLPGFHQLARAAGFTPDQQANGGRIQRKDGGKVMDAQTLVQNAERAKNRINKGTEPLLTVPDEAITKALAIANEKI
jgi:hypothetical protein